MFDDATHTEALECDVCCAQHDEEIHQATLSVHRWFQQEVTKYLHDPEEPGISKVA